MQVKLGTASEQSASLAQGAPINPTAMIGSGSVPVPALPAIEPLPAEPALPPSPPLPPPSQLHALKPLPSSLQLCSPDSLAEHWQS